MLAPVSALRGDSGPSAVKMRGNTGLLLRIAFKFYLSIVMLIKRLALKLPCPTLWFRKFFFGPTFFTLEKLLIVSSSG